MTSLHRCFALEPGQGRLLTDLRTNSFDEAIRNWLDEEGLQLLRVHPRNDIVLAVVEVEEHVEAFVCWIYTKPSVDDPFVGNGGGSSAWLAVAWSFLISDDEDSARTAQGGRAVELIYHAFNEALSRHPSAAGVQWGNVGENLSILLEKRCEFAPISPSSYVRKVNRNDPYPRLHISSGVDRT